MIKAVIFDCTGVLVDGTGKVNLQLLGYISQQLKPRYKIGMLSNLSARHISEYFTPAERLLFDAVTLAAETGIAKPDPRAYRLIAAQLGVGPGQCIFVDDFERRCEAASEEGMRAVLYSSLEQTQREINSLLERD